LRWLAYAALEKSGWNTFNCLKGAGDGIVFPSEAQLRRVIRNSTNVWPTSTAVAPEAVKRFLDVMIQRIPSGRVPIVPSQVEKRTDVLGCLMVDDSDLMVVLDMLFYQRYHFILFFFFF
jgi:hypothetical protein